MKKCVRCGESKDLIEFGGIPGMKNKLREYCNSCVSKQKRKKRIISVRKQRALGVSEPIISREPSENRGIRRRRMKENGGKHTQEEWRVLVSSTGNKCLRCHEAGDQFTLSVDHVVPVALGGRDDISNIQPLCLTCNMKKRVAIVDYRTSPPTRVPKQYANNYIRRLRHIYDTDHDPSCKCLICRMRLG